MNILSFNNQNLQKLRNTQKTHMCSRKRMETLYRPRGQETVAWKHITLQFIHLPSKITFEGILIITKNKKNIDLKLLGSSGPFLSNGSLDGVQLQENSAKVLVLEILARPWKW